MKNISDKTSLDTVSYMHAKIMNGAELNRTNLFGPAVILDGEDDWIDLGWSSESYIDIRHRFFLFQPCCLV